MHGNRIVFAMTLLAACSDPAADPSDTSGATSTDSTESGDGDGDGDGDPDPCAGELFPFRLGATDIVTGAPIVGLTVEVCGQQAQTDQNGDAWFDAAVPLETVVVARTSRS